jgi:hypothetical protein
MQFLQVQRILMGVTVLTTASLSVGKRQRRYSASLAVMLTDQAQLKETKACL